MRVTVELPGTWGERRLVITRLKRLGYTVTEHLNMATGERWLSVG